MGERFYRREELAGKLVYDDKALRVGEVVDVGYSKDGRTALIVRVEGGEERVIPFTMVGEIGDIILLKPAEPEKQTAVVEVTPQPQPTPPEPGKTAPMAAREGEKTCPKCGRLNIARAKFCIKCGYKFP
ncbi:MAG: PRC-barrel domain-containing protein [Candidatus Bathyarchaeia archaeon]|nr:zinc-ribbon domain-containing protein [Candidatus Bathyarchaeota archaeon]